MRYRVHSQPACRRGIGSAVTIVLVCALFVAGCGTVADANQNRPVARHEVKRLVIQEAERLRVPISLALAVAHVESNFNPKARSAKGARGVMQIMPMTARGEYGIEPKLLWRPRLNIRLGLHFLKRLIRRYGGRVDLALSHYNGGSAVGAWANARVIPATARYVARVKRLRRHYRKQLLRGQV
ncbi:MAG: lytic transglycosylase domain-containing protein [Proteobacteria bacterium]|nr:lytic transglycosylase domain-containing protein [Pseudomonadota bacterium]